MIGLDTNVLVRYAAQDDPHQSAIATRFIEGELHATKRGFISLIVLVETCWVLKRLYSATEPELAETVADLLGNPSFQIESRAVVQAAVLRANGLKSKAGVTDFLIVEVCKTQGCSHTVSFDKKAVQQAGMRLLV
jgi:predicted nucleic-acid-binding protein